MLVSSFEASVSTEAWLSEYPTGEPLSPGLSLFDTLYGSNTYELRVEPSNATNLQVITQVHRPANALSDW